MGRRYNGLRVEPVMEVGAASSRQGWPKNTSAGRSGPGAMSGGVSGCRNLRGLGMRAHGLAEHLSQAPGAAAAAGLPATGVLDLLGGTRARGHATMYICLGDGVADTDI